PPWYDGPWPAMTAAESARSLRFGERMTLLGELAERRVPSGADRAARALLTFMDKRIEAMELFASGRPMEKEGADSNALYNQYVAALQDIGGPGTAARTTTGPAPSPGAPKVATTVPSANARTAPTATPRRPAVLYVAHTDGEGVYLRQSPRLYDWLSA